MPELSRFEGMVIKMLFNDTVQHNKPHVHVTYGEYKASVGIDGELLAGSMFVLNGIVYASEKQEDIQIISAKPLDDMMMILTFSTGEQRLFDATVLKGTAFQPLNNEDVFKNCKVVDGAVTWMDEEIDCSPEYMYEHSFFYPDVKSAI